MNKKIALLILFFSFFINEKLAGQTENQTVEIVNFDFSCRSRKESIPLPSDFKGPQYFSYEEGSIVYFFSINTVNHSGSIDDYCIISVLCGANANLSLDSSYMPVEIREDKKDILYYSEEKNKYARRIRLKRYLMTYEHATIEKKEILDKIIDSLQEIEKN